MRPIENIFTKKEISEILKNQKTYKNRALNDADINKRKKIKPNHPPFYSLKIELDNDFIVTFQNNNDDEFPKYTAILLLNKTLICRLDYHDGHRRKCKKELFLDAIYDDLHLHLYCEECIKERFNKDAFVLNIKEHKLLNFDFKCFMALFCKIISLPNTLDCQRGLFS